MHTFATPAPIAAVLDVPAGRIQVIAADRTDTVVEVRPANPARSRDVTAAEQTTAAFADGVLCVDAPTGRNRHLGPSGAVEVTVRVPAGSHVEARSAAAEFRAVGRLGDLDVEGAHGRVRIDEATSVRLTAYGDVALGVLTGPAHISTQKGDITIDRATTGPLDLTTRMGDVTVAAAPGVSATLDAGTAHGRIHNTLANTDGPTAPLAIRATTSHGDITATSL